MVKKKVTNNSKKTIKYHDDSKLSWIVAYFSLTLLNGLLMGFGLNFAGATFFQLPLLYNFLLMIVLLSVVFFYTKSKFFKLTAIISTFSGTLLLALLDPHSLSRLLDFSITGLFFSLIGLFMPFTNAGIFNILLGIIITVYLLKSRVIKQNFIK